MKVMKDTPSSFMRVRIYGGNICHTFIHSYIYFITYIYMNINRIYITLISSAFLKVFMREQLQSSVNSTGTFHLFIGTGRSPSKNTFMTSTIIYRVYKMSLG
jgi:dolichol kinase